MFFIYSSIGKYELSNGHLPNTVLVIRQKKKKTTRVWGDKITLLIDLEDVINDGISPHTQY
jgi:hypothetical protein